MALAADFSLFFAPTINSYKRYQASTFAPTKIAWAKDNRTCGFRVIGEKSSLRIENRIPGADANPYLAFAAALASALYGIDNKMKPPPEFHGDAYHAEELPEVPKSLRDAADFWEQSRAAKEAFGENVWRHYLHAARMEQKSFDSAVTSWELSRYFERI
jgi:glutamine synthetase